MQRASPGHPKRLNIKYLHYILVWLHPSICNLHCFYITVVYYNLHCIHQCKLQWVMITVCASGAFAPGTKCFKEKHHQQKLQSGQDQYQYKLKQDAPTACSCTTTTTDQIRTITGTAGVANAAINATCIGAHHLTLRKLHRLLHQSLHAGQSPPLTPQG